jgi:hypothetical protein
VRENINMYQHQKKHLMTMQNEEYVSPQIRVVECRVENGFAVSEIEIDGSGNPA